MAAIPRAVCHIWGCTIIKDYIYIRRHRLFNIAKYWNNPACLKGQKDQKDWNNPSLKRSKPENSSSLHAHPQHNCWEAGGCPESHFEIIRAVMLRTTNVDDDVFAIAGGFGSGIEKRQAVGRFGSKYSIVYYHCWVWPEISSNTQYFGLFQNWTGSGVKKDVG